MWLEVVECVAKGHEVDNEPTKLEKAVSGMGMFVGNYTHSLDPKRRLTIPSVWRAQIGVPETVYVLPDFHMGRLRVAARAPGGRPMISIPVSGSSIYLIRTVRRETC